MGHSTSKYPISRGVLVHGPANSGVDSTIQFVYSKFPPWQAFPSIRASAELNACIHPGSVLFNEYRYTGRGGIHMMTKADGWEEAKQSLKAVVLVVDASNLDNAFTVPVQFLANVPENAFSSLPNAPASMRERGDWLATMMNQHLELLIDRPTLILVNKCDKPNAVTAEQVRDRLLSKHLTGLNIRVQECSALHGVGMNEGWDWLREQVRVMDEITKLGKSTMRKLLLRKTLKTKAASLKEKFITQLTVASIDRSKLATLATADDAANTSAWVSAAKTAQTAEEGSTSLATKSLDNSVSTASAATSIMAAI